jgi:hypothetical protein
VFLTAAWGLRSLEVPETLPAVTSFVKEKKRRIDAEEIKAGPALVYADHQLSQLNQLLGRRKYQPADAVLRQFVPRTSNVALACPESRSAAVWALGHLHEGKPTPDLVAALEGRLKDSLAAPNRPAELFPLRRMAAVALGLMHAKAALPSLRHYYGAHKPTLDAVNNACGWAVEQITGEVMPAPVPFVRKVLIGGFLSPSG